MSNNVKINNNDIHILGSFINYYPDMKTPNHIIYEMNVSHEDGSMEHIFKAVKLMRLIRLPKSAKQSEVFMEMQSQVLAGIWDKGINFITLIANILKPNPLGLLFLYGVQGVASTLEDAVKMANTDFAAVSALFQGTFRNIEFQLVNEQEVEWLREKMYKLKFMTVVRGLPKPRPGGTDTGAKFFGGNSANEDAQDTTEEFIAGMTDKEYVIQILSSPISQKTLQAWLKRTAQEASRWYGQLQGQNSLSAGINIPIVFSGNLGSSSGWSHGYSDGESVGYSTSHSTGVTTGESVGESYGTGTSHGISYSEGDSASSSVGHTEGSSYGFNSGENISGSVSKGVSSNYGESSGMSNSVGTSEGSSISSSENIGGSKNSSISGNFGDSQNQTTTQAQTDSTSNAKNWSQQYGVSGDLVIVKTNFGGSYGESVTETGGNSSSTGNTTGNSSGAGYSIGGSLSSGYSNSQNQSSGISSGVSTNIGQSIGTGASQSWSESNGLSKGESWGGSASDSVSNSRGISRSEGWSTGLSESESVNYSKSVSKSETEGYSDSFGRSKSFNQGVSNGISSGSGASFGLGGNIGYSKSFAWIDKDVKNIIDLLEFQNERLMKATSGSGAFYTDVYIVTEDEEGLSAARSLAKSAWYNPGALVSPLQTLDLDPEEQSHLLYHFQSFSPDITKDTYFEGTLSNYRYTTILLPEEQAAFTHPPRISEGGVYADVADIPKFSVPSMRKGEIYMGQILSGERYSMKTGYKTPFPFRLSNEELMHGIFTGESRSGKTVTATRFIAELANKVKRADGKRLRIVCMDPKQDWRVLAKFVEPERFRFYSFGNPEFHPINLNICKIPKNVYPQQWIDGIIEIYCRAYGLAERGKTILAETLYELYDEAHVFDEDWRETAPERSSKVTLPAVYRRMLTHKLELEDPTSGKGRVGNDVRDAYARVLDRLRVFDRNFTIEYRLFGNETGMGVDELIGNDDVVVLESYGLESTFKNFIFGVITSGFFKYAQAHEGGFKAKDQFETVLVIEEANEVITGQDSADKGSSSLLAGQSEFEKILDQSAGLGLFIMSITQKIAAMPSSVIANSGLIFAGKISREQDVSVVIRKIGREEKFDDRDLVKWFPRSPIGWFVCRSSRNHDFKEVEPVLVAIAPLGIDPPRNEELSQILALKKVHETLSA